MSDRDDGSTRSEERWGLSDLPLSLLIAVTGGLMLVASWLLWDRFGLLSVSGAVVGALLALIGVHGAVRSVLRR